jgi:DNA polymerase III alpha subunit
VFKVIDQIIAAAQLETRMRNTGQTSMFGALGQSTQESGMPGIVLNGPDVTVEEKAAWERELLGVSLSYNPMFLLASIDAGDAISSLDQLDEDLQGQSLTLLGHVSAMNERYTREQKKFLVVSLELLGGPVEAIVWPDVLERTQEVWREGKLVKATGKMRVRGDQFSLACEQVEEYVAPAEETSQCEATPHPVEKSNELDSPKARAKPVETGRPANGTKKAAPAAVATRAAGTRAVVLNIQESSNALDDAHLLREVIQVLLEYPGKDRVNLQIHTRGKRVLMELPVVSPGYCDEMKGRLESVLGADTVALQGGEGPDFEDVPF